MKPLNFHATILEEKSYSEFMPRRKQPPDNTDRESIRAVRHHKVMYRPVKKLTPHEYERTKK